MTPAQVEDAATLWGARPGSARLISHRENAVYEVDLSGTRAALRIHRPGYQSTAAILAELSWTSSLAGQGFPCPQPLPSTGGRMVEDGPAGAATCVSWVNGTPIGPTETPSPDTYKRLGSLLKTLHETTARLPLPKFPRAHWDIDGLLGNDPLWGRFWDHPLLTPPEAARLQQARTAARAALADAPDLILIHADAIQENVFDDGDALWLIDFDDCGYGFPGYELGVAMSQHQETPHEHKIRDALYAGYGADPAQAPLYEMLRSLASTGWAITRVPAQDPRQRDYINRALTLADRYLDHQP